MTKIVVTDNTQEVHAFSFFVIDPADMQEIIMHAQTLHNKRAAQHRLQAMGLSQPGQNSLVGEWGICGECGLPIPPRA